MTERKVWYKGDMITESERSRRCEEVAAALRGKTIKSIEIFHGDDDAGDLSIGEIVLEGGGTIVLDRDEEDQFSTRIYRPGTGHSPETWASWSAARPAPTPDPLAHIRAAREWFAAVGPVLEGIDDDDPIHLAARDLWRAITADLDGGRP